jgi:DNA polymerase elongation subunit (family B)
MKSSIKVYLMQILTIAVLLIQPANAVIECKGYGYKITGDNPATVFQIDPNNPSNVTKLLSEINVQTNAMGYSLQHGIFFAKEHSNDSGLIKIDENGNVTQVPINNLGSHTLENVIMDVSYDG